MVANSSQSTLHWYFNSRDQPAVALESKRLNKDFTLHQGGRRLGEVVILHGVTKSFHRFKNVLGLILVPQIQPIHLFNLFTQPIQNTLTV